MATGLQEYLKKAKLPRNPKAHKEILNAKITMEKITEAI